MNLAGLKVTACYTLISHINMKINLEIPQYESKVYAPITGGMHTEGGGGWGDPGFPTPPPPPNHNTVLQPIIMKSTKVLTLRL